MRGPVLADRPSHSSLALLTPKPEQPGKPGKQDLPFWERLPRISRYSWCDYLYADCCT